MKSPNDLLDPLHHIPRDLEGPVFAAPWQAEVFALTLTLHERGVFEWTEWADRLHRAIDAAQAAGDPDLGDTYYNHWLAALEALLLDKGIAAPGQLESLYQAWDDAARRTPHGQAITL